MKKHWLDVRTKRTKTLSFTSGKGGVGKTTLLTNIAIQFARQGKRVLLLDGDFGMANIDVMFGVRPKHSLYDVIRGEKSLGEVIVDVSENVSLIPGGSGIYELAHLSDLHKQAMLHQISDLDGEYDYMLIDTAPGIDDNVLYLNSAAQEINVIVTPDPSSITDAYALIKVLNKRRKEENFSIICNQVKGPEEGLALFKKISDVASKFLYVSLDYKGHVPLDLEIRRAIRRQKVLSECDQISLGSRAISSISKTYGANTPIIEAKGGMQFFWQQMAGFV